MTTMTMVMAVGDDDGDDGDDDDDEFGAPVPKSTCQIKVTGRPSVCASLRPSALVV